MQGQTILLVSSPAPHLAANHVNDSVVKPLVLSEIVSPTMAAAAAVMNVIQVPTTLLLTNNVLVIPQEGYTLEVPTAANATVNGINIQPATAALIDQGNNGKWLVSNNGQLSQLTATDFSNNQAMQPLEVLTIQECINVEGSKAQIAIPAAFSDLNQLNDGSIIQFVDTSPAATTDANDINNFLAATAAVTIEDTTETAKSWYEDSLISYRAMLAFNEVTTVEPDSTTTSVAHTILT